jgi:hypothetical protein
MLFIALPFQAMKERTDMCRKGWNFVGTNMSCKRITIKNFDDGRPAQ